MGQELIKAAIEAGKVVLGGLVTLGAVWMTSKFQSEQQVRRLAAEADHARLDRIASARREIYLPLVDASMNLLAVMGRLGEPKAALTYYKEIPLFQSAIARAKLVSEGKNVELLTKLSSAAMNGYITLMRESLQLADIDVELEQAQAEADSASKNLEQWDRDAAERGFNVSPLYVPERQRRLENVVFASEEVAKLSDERTRAHIAFTSKVAPVSRVISNCSDEVLIALRLELEAGDTDEIALRASTERSADQANRLTEEFLAALEGREDKNT
ncbi:hypothetical protein LMG19145_01963 [Xanthomonas arboricola pv. fragariae]|nr:hypothetical protein LMG19145_01963 [Xanthomonas arboricola pv. fragariae]